MNKNFTIQLLLLLLFTTNIFANIDINIIASGRGVLMSISSVDEVTAQNISTDSSVQIKLMGCKIEAEVSKSLPSFIADGNLLVSEKDGISLISIDNPSFNGSEVKIRNSGNRSLILLSGLSAAKYDEKITVLTTLSEESEESVDISIEYNNSVTTEDKEEVEVVEKIIEEAIVTVDSVTLVNRDGLEFLEIFGNDLFVDSVINSKGKSELYINGSDLKAVSASSEFDSKFLIDNITFDKAKIVISIKENGNFLFVSEGTLGSIKLAFSDSREKEKIILSSYQNGKVSSSNLFVRTKRSPVINNISNVSKDIIGTIALTKNSVNVRKTTDTSSPDNIVGKFSVDTKFDLLSVEGEWYKILVNGEIGWVYSTLAKKVSDENNSGIEVVDLDIEEETVTIKDSTILFLIKDDVNVRTSPKTSGIDNIIKKLPLGTRFVLKKKSNGWFQVDMDGTDCWVYGKMVEDSLLITDDQWDAIYNNQSSDSDLSVVDEFEGDGDMPELDESLEDGGFALNSDSTKSAKPNDDELAKEKYSFHRSKINSYRKFGRDPFLPLDKSDFLKSDLPSLSKINIVGIMYDPADAVALFEEDDVDGETATFALKVGDRIENGKVLQISEDRVRFLIQESDFSYSVDKELREKKE
jgi:uncharacterized protein YgiM (DUF1202 family)